LKANIWIKICLETMSYFWNKATEEYSPGAHKQRERIKGKLGEF